MPVSIPPLRLANRPAAWKWLVCGLLLLATTVNYMDRQTLAQLAPRVMDDLHFREGGYGRLESAFAVAFAFGSLLMGFLADRVGVRLLYPAAVVVWSAAGFLTGFAQGFAGLLACRFLLGLAESANWPCGLKTTQRILPPAERSLGNSLLQSGASVGSILTPLVVAGLLWATGSWRHPFLAVGVIGLAWAAAWLLIIRPGDLDPLPAVARAEADPPALTGLAVRRYAALVVLVVSINVTWHFFRAWLNLFLRTQHGYSEQAMTWFIPAYFVATDVGTLAAGYAALRLARAGMSVHRSRVLVYLACALLTALSVVAAWLPAGPLLLGVLLVIGFGALGLFPVYYAFSQELTTRHQGKLTGSLGCLCWLAMATLQAVVGEHVERTGSYRLGVALAGLAPLVGLAALLLLWGKTPAAPAGDGRPLPGGDRPADERVRPAPAAAG